MTGPIIAGVVAVVAILGGIAALVFSRREERTLDERLEEIDQFDDFASFLEASDEPEEEETSASVQDEIRSFLDPINRSLSQRQFGQNMRKKLARANVKLTVAEYAASHFIASAMLFTVGFVFITSGDLLTSIAFGLIGFFLPRFFVGRAINKRLREFETQLPDTLGLWVNGLRSGYSVLQAIEAISQDAPEPTKTEFERVVKEVQIGIDMDDAFGHLLERIESEDLDLVVTAVSIQRDTGGNLAEILEVISHTIRERIKLKGEIRVLTSQGRYTGYLISGLPIALTLLLQVISPGFMNPMFESRECGWPMLGVGLALIGIGSVAIARIVDIEI